MLLLVKSFHLSLGRAQQVTVVHLAIELRLQSLDRGGRRVTVSLCLQLLCAIAYELFLQDLVLMGDTPRLLLRLISLLTHVLHILLQRCGSLLQDSDLLTSCRLVIGQSMHLVVVHLDISGQVSTSTFIDTDFFT